MSYFQEIHTYDTYSGSDDDFHFIYNSNSGGGQAFLGGKYIDAAGTLVSPETLNGKTSVFCVKYIDETGMTREVALNDSKAKYDIKPRGNGSTSMKLGVGNDREAPSRIISSFFMLPPTCGVKMPVNLNHSILSSSNFWLLSMWLDCNVDVQNSNEIKLIPRDYVFCGGINKDNDTGVSRYFSLNSNKRIMDIIHLANTVEPMFPDTIMHNIILFSDIYQGRRDYNYDECSTAIKEIMVQLASLYPEKYSGISDPLSSLVEIVNNQQSITVAEADEKEIDDILNHTLYGMHIKEKNDALSDERPHICIGWSDMGDLSDVASKEELAARYASVWPKAKPRTQGQNIGQVWRFINDMKVGDYVIFADGNLLHIGRVDSDYYYDDTQYDAQSEDYKNNRRVVWLKKNIQRSEVSDAMHRSLMTAMSIWTMNDYRAAIADLLNGTYIKDDDLDTDEAVPSADQKERFKKWMSEQKKDNGDPYSSNTINSYVSQMERGYAEFEKYADYDSIFEIQRPDELIEYKEYLFNAEGFDAFNDRAGNKACSCGIIKYLEFISESEQDDVSVCFSTSLNISLPRNRIVFGAPGTGKSFTINKERKALLGENNEADYERVTFHPDYSYANFVGTYKPVPHRTEDGKETVTYEYVPGPFMRVYVKALRNAMSGDPRPFLLIIEEINRANVAAVFGDVFQLLDRNELEISEYPIQASEDIKKYLAKELKCSPDKVEKILIPDNLFIWATMNSADQGVFPMDTAFKRRWDFTYIGINHNMEEIDKYVFTLPNGERINWNKLRKAINNRLASLKINEDKLLGPFFLSRKVLDAGDDAFLNAFENKVLMYIFEDAGKQRRTDIFRDNQKSDGDVLLYSVICENFRKKGTDIFCDEIKNAAPYEVSVVKTDDDSDVSEDTINDAENQEVTESE